MDDTCMASLLQTLGTGLFTLIGLCFVWAIVDWVLEEIKDTRRQYERIQDDEIERLEDELDNEREVSADLRRLIKDLKEGKTNV